MANNAAFAPGRNTFESDAKGSFETENGAQVGGGEIVGRKSVWRRGTEKTRKQEVTM
jgi:hypothetical protein